MMIENALLIQAMKGNALDLNPKRSLFIKLTYPLARVMAWVIRRVK